jgi:predicted amidohydrolase
MPHVVPEQLGRVKASVETSRVGFPWQLELAVAASPEISSLAKDILDNVIGIELRMKVDLMMSGVIPVSKSPSVGVQS